MYVDAVQPPPSLQLQAMHHNGHQNSSIERWNVTNIFVHALTDSFQNSPSCLGRFQINTGTLFTLKKSSALHSIHTSCFGSNNSNIIVICWHEAWKATTLMSSSDKVLLIMLFLLEVLILHTIQCVDRIRLITRTCMVKGYWCICSVMRRLCVGLCTIIWWKTVLRRSHAGYRRNMCVPHFPGDETDLGA